jgi:hypothetical protein
LTASAAGYQGAVPDPSTLTALGLVCSLKPSPAPSSSAQRVLERLDAELSNTDDSGTPALVGKVAIVSVVGTRMRLRVMRPTSPAR